MSDAVKASVSIEYKADEDTDDLGPPEIVLQNDDLKAPYGYGHARLFFIGQTPALLSTSGYAINVVNRAVTSDEIDFITFQGKDEASFEMPGVSNVTLQPLGKLFGMKGESLSNVKLTVDAARGTIKAKKPFYGTIQANYNSTFQRLRGRFREIPGAEDNPSMPSVFSPMVIIARQGENEPVSLELKPPDKTEDPKVPGGAGGHSDNDKSTGDIIVLELDSTFPVGLTHSTQEIPGLAACARVIVSSTHGGVSFSVSNGFVKPDPYRLSQSVPIIETVNFVGSQSQSTKYPPANGVSVSQVGAVTSKQTPGGTFLFVTAPYDVTLADWFSYGAYVPTGVRTVQSNEIVATSVGVAVAVSGAVKATYNTLRDSITVYWSRSGTWFDPVVLTATDAWGNSQSLVINPPERRGR